MSILQNVLSDSYSLLLLDLHGEAFHVGVFKVKADVLSAKAQVRRQSRGLRSETGGKSETETHSHEDELTRRKTTKR